MVKLAEDSKVDSFAERRARRVARFSDRRLARSIALTASQGPWLALLLAERDRRQAGVS